MQLSSLSTWFSKSLKEAPSNVVKTICKFRVEKGVFQKCTEHFKQAYKASLKESKGECEISNILQMHERMKQACTGNLLSAPMFLDLVIQATREHLMAFNVSHEIAKFIHIKMLARAVDNLDFDEFMFYNLDRTRLEE